ncbi:MAG: HD domain-containing protein [Bacteroidia bacterium]|nr:HD domain-containing protein [Bacteroidia bacterium]MDW8236175.1 HD domain-containing protein [Bacteroidia bacterium]
MLPTAKIVNDPVHGFIRLPQGRILQVLHHPIVQRLRRLSQLGLAQFVYPGAVHTRFAHALGVMHLADEALSQLTKKGVSISSSTWEAVLLAALLHDIGHGPFSHSLEGKILPLSHEDIGLLLLDVLEREVGDLSEVRALWEKKHSSAFLSELISSQLDVDRLDYLVRDSFFTGVQEGLVGTERLIHTMAVSQNHLVIEEKGLTSVEKFIITRRFMYWQVYLHKGVVGAEWLLRRWWEALCYEDSALSPLKEIKRRDALDEVEGFIGLDDTVIWYWVQRLATEATFPPLRALSRAILWRRPYKVIFGDANALAEHLALWEASLPPKALPWREWFQIEGVAENRTYHLEPMGEIRILRKDGSCLSLTEMSPWLEALGTPMRRTFAGVIPAVWLESLLP